MLDTLQSAITDTKIPAGEAAASGLLWLQNTFAGAIGALEEGVRHGIGAVSAGLTTPHPLIVIAVFAVLTWAVQRRLVAVAIVVACALFTLNQGYWVLTMQTLALVFCACVLCMGVGVPAGVCAAHWPRLGRALAPVLNLMQALPGFVYLVPALALFGLGMVPGLMATVIFALPASIRLTQRGVAATPAALNEAAAALGATARQRIVKVELRWAWPQIMAALGQTIMLSLSMVVIAGMVGAPGLGVPIVRALTSSNAALGLESGLVIMAVAIMLQTMVRAERRA